MSDRALFEVRDVGIGSSSAETEGDKKYMGAERRRDDRRSGKDQRTEVRFEPSKDDRRKSWGRRLGDVAGHIW